jgi:hypothetical protein
MKTDMRAWLARTAGASVNAVAAEIGMTQTTLNAQINGSATLKPETVVKIARAYEADPVAALVELGLITAEEAGAVHDLTEADHLAWLADDQRATDAILLDEIGRRLDERNGGTSVTPIRPKSSDPAPRVPARRVAKKSAEKAGASEFEE